MKATLALLLAAVTGMAVCAYGAQRAVLVPDTVSHRPASLLSMAAQSAYEVLPMANGGGTLDLRGADLADIDMIKNGPEPSALLEEVVFDTGTRWPDALPEDFVPALLLALGRDPGLGMRALHDEGITGKGIGIAIIDQPLLVEHVEYADRLRLYRAYGRAQDAVATEHGTAAAAIALGVTTGVAPGAYLYYIADDPLDPDAGVFRRDFSRYAQHIDRLIALNRSLPEAERIRVIALAIGWAADEPGVPALESAIARARAAGIAVLWRSEEDPLSALFSGMGRDAYGDPNDIASTRPALARRGALYAGKYGSLSSILVPMDGRTVASPMGEDAYTYYARGGEGWSVPYVAGLYALACEAVPDITFEAFAQAALDTARSVFVMRGDLAYPYGQVADPAALLAALRAAPATPLPTGHMPSLTPE